MPKTITVNAAPEASELRILHTIEPVPGDPAQMRLVVHVAVMTDQPGPLDREHVSSPDSDVTYPAPSTNLDSDAKRHAYLRAILKAQRGHAVALLGL